MAGIITAIVFQKKNKERVNIFLDDQFAFGLNLNAALTLSKGQQLTDTEIAALKFEDEIVVGYNQALNYLGYRARSQQEVEQYLYKKEIGDTAINTIIARLTEQTYLNDLEFARAWVKNRTNLNPKGKRALHYELRQKGISEQIITQVLNDLPEETLAWQAIAKKLSRWQKLDELAFKQKLSGFLARRGFNYETIEAVFKRAWSDNNR